jgi:hypothetical protein
VDLVFGEDPLLDPADDPATCHDRRNCAMAVRFCTITAQFDDLENATKAIRHQHVVRFNPA